MHMYIPVVIQVAIERAVKEDNIRPVDVLQRALGLYLTARKDERKGLRIAEVCKDNHVQHLYGGIGEGK